MAPDSDDDDLQDFLDRYAACCAQAGITPLPLDALAVLASALLTGLAPGATTLH
jgi:hypothetical protein